MKINQAGIDLIKSFEECLLTSYEDIVGIVTIGYGHTGMDVGHGGTITQEQADALLLKDLEYFEDGVEKLLVSHTTSNEFSALVCFAFNVGLHALANSTLLRKLNLGDYTGAAEEFCRWDKAGGKEVPGLLRRREAERDLFLSNQ